MMSERDVASNVLKSEMNLGIEEKRAFDTAMRDHGDSGYGRGHAGFSATHQASMRR